MTNAPVARTDRPTDRSAELAASALVNGTDLRRSANDSVQPEVFPRAIRAAYRPSRLKRAADQLSERDWSILRSLGLVRLLTAAQLQRLHFREGSELTRARRARRSLARLHDLHLVQRLERRVGGVHAGSSGFIYGLSGWGQRLIGGAGPAGGSRRRRSWEPSTPFQDHVLAISELYVTLVEASTNGDRELVAFDAEPNCWRRFDAQDGTAEILKPDAYVILADDHYEYVSFVEVDLGTEGVTALRRKAEVYVAYAASGAEARRSGVFPFVVWLAPDEPRVTTMQRALRPVADPAGYFSVGLLSEAQGLLLGSAREPPTEPDSQHLRERRKP